MSGGVVFEILLSLFAVYGLYCALAEVKLHITRVLKRGENKIDR